MSFTMRKRDVFYFLQGLLLVTLSLSYSCGCASAVAVRNYSLYILNTMISTPLVGVIQCASSRHTETARFVVKVSPPQAWGIAMLEIGSSSSGLRKAIALQRWHLWVLAVTSIMARYSVDFTRLFVLAQSAATRARPLETVSPT